jgi:hypothetical protein
MKTLIITTAAIALMAGGPAYAGKNHDDVLLGAAIGLGVGILAFSQPTTTTVYNEAPVVYQPAPVAYYQPAPTVVYQTPPVVYYQPAPPPPVYYAPAPVYYRSHRAYEHPRHVHRHGYRYADGGGYYHGGY